MKFGLVDRIVALTSGERLVAVKAVSLAEEYLADHFPTFPVLPGVFMLQALVESASWLVREALDFGPTVVLLHKAKNVTYQSFVRPGNLLRLEVECRRLAPGDSDFEGAGFRDQVQVVKARFSLRHFRLADRSAAFAETDRKMTESARARFELLNGSVIPG